MWKKNNDYIEKKHSAIVTPPTNAKAAGDNNSKSRWQQQQKLFGPKRIMISLCGRQKDLAHCFVAPIVLLNLSWREYHCILAPAEHKTILDDIVQTGGQWDQLCFSSNIFLNINGPLCVTELLLRIDEPLYISAILRIAVTWDWLVGSLLLYNIIFNWNKNIVYKVFN